MSETFRASPSTGVWDGATRLRDALAANLAGTPRGVYSVCCSHPLVIEAAVDQAVADNSDLLIEATANQVNQFGGYTGMQPADYRDYVHGIAAARGLPADRLMLGGDHLGPVCWTSDAADVAMDKAERLVRDFAAAGFAKIHLDCSMPLSDDPDSIDDAVVAARAARLCRAAEEAAVAAFGSSGIVYVIGTEVPPPGGADEALDALEVTPADRVQATLAVHRTAFADVGLSDVWPRVVAIVVQPGVEFDHTAVIAYEPAKARHLRTLAQADGNRLVFEAHSTDYQPAAAFAALVRDHFAILKVGPALTFAMREALFGLSHVEDEIVAAGERSNLRQVCEARMIAEPRHWVRFYDGDPDHQRLLRRYSLSDRIRYYWPDPAIDAAVERLFANLSAGHAIPVGLLHQYLPHAALDGPAAVDAPALVRAAVRAAIAPYARACQGKTTS